ncbi:MAG: DUF1559 family PulG-like putative transporter [Armatimonadota bacterium]
MQTRIGKGGFTLIELVVVLFILVVLAVILFPIQHGHNGGKARQATCNSNVRQLALAIQMYASDNQGQFPGIDGGSWVKKISPYLGSSAAMFMCPSDNSGNSGKVSYAMSGLLIQPDGTGIKEAQVLSPSEVGSIADAEPTEIFLNGRLIGGGGQQPVENIAATLEPRHSKGLIVGFCDGHAKYFQGAVNLLDEGNGAVRAMYHAAPLGLVDNPVGMMPAGGGIKGSGTLVVGGEYASYPFLMAAAKMHGDYKNAGFKGQGFTDDRPVQNWAWGTVSGAKGPSSPAIAYDALVFIVAKGCKIPAMPSLSNQTYLVNTATVRALFQAGYVKDSVQVYHMPTAYSATDGYARAILGLRGYGKGTIQVANDAEMVEKVSNDPWAIGYCSSAFADPDRVVILAFDLGADGGKVFWPRGSNKFRWVMPSRKDSTWPWKRSINVVTRNNPNALEASVVKALHGGGLYDNLANGPLFTWGYWPGDY